jgi:transposase
MRLNYPDLIRETPEELARLERKHRSSPLEDRLKMLRLLKAETYPSRMRLAPVLGYSPRQLQRWWDAYRRGSLEALLDRASPGGSAERISAEAWTALETEMKAGRVARLREARGFLREHFSTSYTIGGLSDLFRRRKAKLKTGRRRNRKASPEEQAVFKKTVPG